jgi:hypothetical protein
MKLLMEQWRRYLTEFTELLSQVKTGVYKPLPDEVWEAIEDEGYSEEEGLQREDFEYITLTIPHEDAKALRDFSDEAIEKYNRFDIKLKDLFERHIDLIDYDKGIVRVVRVIK